MSFAQQIEKDYLVAYKAKDEVRVAVLRLLKTAMKNRQVELRHDLSDDDVIDIVKKQAKQRRESIEQFEAAGRKELADKEAVELEVLTSYLPEPLAGDELDQAVIAAIAETGATSMKDMGRVMQALTAAYGSRLDGKAASAAVKQRLSA
jgi:uncharacterized protein YqeY